MLRNGYSKSVAYRLRGLMTYMIRVVRQRAHITRCMFKLKPSSAFLILDFKVKWLCHRHSESQAFHFGIVGISVHVAAVIRTKSNVPEEIIARAMDDVRNVNKWVWKIFEVHHLIQMIDQPHKQDGPLTLALMEDVMCYLKKSPKF